MKNNKKISNKLYNVISDTAFIVLPFNEKWSDDVTSGIKEVCEGLGIKANRADDLYNTKNTCYNITHRELLAPLNDKYLL